MLIAGAPTHAPAMLASMDGRATLIARAAPMPTVEPSVGVASALAEASTSLTVCTSSGLEVVTAPPDATVALPVVRSTLTAAAAANCMVPFTVWAVGIWSEAGNQPFSWPKLSRLLMRSLIGMPPVCTPLLPAVATL